MTVSTSTSKQSYTGNGVTTLFAFTPPFLASSDLQVYVGGVLKTLTTDYTVSGTAPYPSGANITFLVAPGNGVSVVIARVVPYTQTLHLVANDPMPADAVEQRLDANVMMVGQLLEQLNRALVIPITDTTGLTVTLPAAAIRANQAIIFDSVGNMTVGAVAQAPISPAMQPVAAATTLPLARTALGLGAAATLNEAFTTEATIAAASSTDLGTLASNIVVITGNTGITGFGNTANTNNPFYLVRFTGTPLLTNSGTLILPGSINFQAAAGDMAIAKFEGASTWRIFPMRASGLSIASVDQQLNSLGLISLTPQGRLSLSSTAPVMTADLTAQTTIYYLPYVGRIVPVWDGTAMVPVDVGASGISLTLNATNHPNNEVFDIYLSMQAGVPTLSAMYWGANTSRSTVAAGKSGTGNASTAQKNGLNTNNAALAITDSFNGSTGIAVSQNQGTKLGSFYTTAAGQTGVNIKPAGASGGSGNIVGLFNDYNRVPLKSMCFDNASWTYAVNTFRAMHGSNNNRVTYLDGLQCITPKGSVINYVTGSVSYDLGMLLDATSGSPITYAQAASAGVIGSHPESWAPQLGLHFIQAMESNPAVTTQTLNATTASAVLILETEY